MLNDFNEVPQTTVSSSHNGEKVILKHIHTPADLRLCQKVITHIFVVLIIESLIITNPNHHRLSTLNLDDSPIIPKFHTPTVADPLLLLEPQAFNTIKK